LGSIVTLRRAMLCRYTAAAVIERVLLCSLLLWCRVIFSVATMPPLRHQRNTGRSVSIRRGIVTTGQIVSKLSCSVTFEDFVLAFCDVFRISCDFIVANDTSNPQAEA
jgi:hypothetical protein